MQVDPRAVLYLRDSGGRDQDLSTEQQERALRKYAAETGTTVTRVFADVARSGGSLVGRDQFLEMVRYLETGEERTVLLWDYSRFARDYDDGQYYLSHLRRQKIIVTSIKEQIPDGPIGRVVESLHIWTAAEYRRQLSDNVKRGLTDAAAVYRSWTTGPPPTGYMIELIEIGRRRDGSPHYARRLVPDPVKAPIVRQAFELRAEGRSYTEIHIATRLHTSHSSYKKMLNSQIYIGVHRIGGVSVHDFCEPLIDAALWDAVQARRSMLPRRESSPYLLSGIVHCSVCGHALMGRTYNRHNGRINRYYHCGGNRSAFDVCPASKIPADDLEARVLANLRALLTAPEMLGQIYAQLERDYASHGETSAARADVLRSEIAAIDAARRKWLSLVEREPDPPRAVLDRLRELDQDQQTRREELIALEAARPAQPPPAADMTDRGAELWEAIEDARVNDFRLLQLLLRAVVGEVTARRVGGQIVGDMLINEIPGVGRVDLRINL